MAFLTRNSTWDAMPGSKATGNPQDGLALSDVRGVAATVSQRAADSKGFIVGMGKHRQKSSLVRPHFPLHDPTAGCPFHVPRWHSRLQ